MAHARGLTIDVLYADRCPHVADAEREIARAVHDAGADPDAVVRLVRIQDDSHAPAQAFAGSPTVLVNGLDVGEANGLAPADIHGCREYVGTEGVRLPFPPASLVARAIDEARASASARFAER